eukprot:SAG31_NODE_2753_length_5141_cov_3.640619_4_plen_67_part_00
MRKKFKSLFFDCQRQQVMEVSEEWAQKIKLRKFETYNQVWRRHSPTVDVCDVIAVVCFFSGVDACH